jgi:hypothetical protein
MSKKNKAVQEPPKSSYRSSAEARTTAGEIPVFCAYDELVATPTLTGNPRNPNKHPQEQIKLLATIIRSQGWRAPITVSRRSGFVVRGHGRLDAALDFGAELTGRIAYLTELDPKYCNVIVNRYARITGNINAMCERGGQQIPYAVLKQENDKANGREPELK